MFEVGRVFGWPTALNLAVIAAATLAFGYYARSLGKPVFIVMLILMIPLATTELGTDSWITSLVEPVMSGFGMAAGWVLVYTALIMTVLRLCAGPIVRHISPLGLLAACSVVAASGLLLLSGAQAAVMLLLAATVFGIGKAFFWPTMLGVVAEQSPRGGALTLNATSALADAVNHRPEAEQDHLIEEVIVYGRAEQHIGAAGTASEGMVGYADFHLPPMLRVGELVESMPGMVATQHSGTGKANQYFLRGFNLDHGTDFSAHLDGVPINMRSHGHGQGYLNFIIPELVETAAFRKGPYHAEKGDFFHGTNGDSPAAGGLFLRRRRRAVLGQAKGFSSAGSIDFAYYERLPESVLQATMGEHGYWRGVVAGTADAGAGALTWAADATVNAGPWRPTKFPGAPCALG